MDGWIPEGLNNKSTYGANKAVSELQDLESVQGFTKVMLERIREKFERVSRVAEQEEIVWSPQSQLTHPVACLHPLCPLSVLENVSYIH